MTKKFSELTRDFSKERRERIDEKKDLLREEMNLAEIRQALKLTQESLAEVLDVGQSEVSKIENRTDMYVSTLRKFIEAMGGELEIKAVFPDHHIVISSFEALEKPEARIL